MKQKESNLKNMILSLFMVTLIAGISLSVVHKITEGPIAKAKAERKMKALKAVLPAFTNDPAAEMKKVPCGKEGDSVEIYPATKDGQPAGAAVISFSDKGFSGRIKIMTGFFPDGKIRNIVVLEQKETPGLGNKITDEAFTGQYRDKNPDSFDLRVKKDGGEVDALTGATISSRAFSEAVQTAYDFFKDTEIHSKTGK